MKYWEKQNKKRSGVIRFSFGNKKRGDRSHPWEEKINKPYELVDSQ